MKRSDGDRYWQSRREAQYFTTVLSSMTRQMNASRKMQNRQRVQISRGMGNQQMRSTFIHCPNVVFGQTYLNQRDHCPC